MVWVEGENPLSSNKTSGVPTLTRLQEQGPLGLPSVTTGLHAVLVEDVVGIWHGGETPPSWWGARQREQGPWKDPRAECSIPDLEPPALCTGLWAEVGCTAGAHSVVGSELHSRWKGPWTLTGPAVSLGRAPRYRARVPSARRSRPLPPEAVSILTVIFALEPEA